MFTAVTHPWARVSITLVLCLATGVARADEAADVARRIEQAVRELHALREQRAAAAERHRDATAELDRQIDRLQQDVDRVRERVVKARDEVRTLERHKTDTQVATAAIKSRIDRVAGAVEPAATSVDGRITAGIPFERDTRSARAKEATTGLGAEDRALRARAVAGYFTLIADELKYGNTVALWNDEVLLDGGARKLNAYHIRLGLVTQAFVSEDRTTVGLYDRAAADGWNTSLDAPQRQSVIDALEIMQAQRPPRLIAVPMSAAEPSAGVSK